MGWHTVLFNGCLDVASGKQTKEPTGKTLMLDGGTSNFQWMAAAWWLGWSLANKDESKIALASDRILDLYAREKVVGHQLLEQCCPMPHDTFHRMAHATIRKLAIENGNSKILNANDQWWLWRLALDEAGATPDGQVILPGARGDGAPLSQIADAIYRMYAGLSHPGPARREAWWGDPIYGGGAPKVMREMHGNGPWDASKIFGNALSSSLPKLRLPMYVNRDVWGFEARLLGDKEREPVISMVRVEYGFIGRHVVVFEKDWDPTTLARA